MGRVIGLTGGIACGKSLISSFLLMQGIPVVDADKVARLVVTPGSPGLALVREVFGEEILLPDGQLDRKKLGDIVFQDAAKRQQLNHIMAPLIFEEIRRQLNGLQQFPVVVVDAPLLFEQPDYLALMDEIWLVVADEVQQVIRLQHRNGYSEEEALLRIHAQMPVHEKLARADVIIYNNGSKEETLEQVKQALHRIG